MATFADVAREAAGRHGLVTRRRLEAAGVPASTLQHWLDSGRLEPVQRGVYRVVGAPLTWAQALLGAVLAAGEGAVASHRAAARLWDLVDDDTLEVATPERRGRRLRGATLHYAPDLLLAAVVHRSGVPTTTPTRTLLDLGAVVGARQVEAALDRALVRRLVTVEGVERGLDDVARRGRAGAGVLRQVLDERALGTDRPDSLLEPRMARLLRAAQLPPGRFQYEVHHRRRLVARVDFGFPDRLVAVEVDGFGPHSSRAAFQRDRDRQNDLVALGWRVVRFTWHDVVRRPDTVANRLRPFLLDTSNAGMPR